MVDSKDLAQRMGDVVKKTRPRTGGIRGELDHGGDGQRYGGFQSKNQLGTLERKSRAVAEKNHYHFVVWSPDRDGCLRH